MPWYSESGYGTPERLSKQGAYALLARVALYAGGYSLRWNFETNDPSTLQMARRSDDAKVRSFIRLLMMHVRQLSIVANTLWLKHKII